MWETPFSPTNRTFPCTQQRPPDLNREAAEQRMYLANHNLNTEISFGGTSLLVPTTALINETNAVEGYGSLGLMASDCTGELSSTCFAEITFEGTVLTHSEAGWSRPPNFLLVDFYNKGNFPGSVFAVAARHNNVTYDRPCCGVVPSATCSLRPNWILGITLGLLGLFMELNI